MHTYLHDEGRIYYSRTWYIRVQIILSTNLAAFRSRIHVGPTGGCFVMAVTENRPSGTCRHVSLSIRPCSPAAAGLRIIAELHPATRAMSCFRPLGRVGCKHNAVAAGRATQPPLDRPSTSHTSNMHPHPFTAWYDAFGRRPAPTTRSSETNRTGAGIRAQRSQSRCVFLAFHRPLPVQNGGMLGLVGNRSS